ncbi:MAG: glycosyltransferase family 2 protein [Chitinophagaceae bacterium]
MLIEDKTRTNSLLDKESFFWTPAYLDVSAWIEHIPFSFWIMEVLKPRRVVELGVHTGVSYFSFCQAAERLNIDTTCYGVDTWKGDEHSGFYEENIFARVMEHNQQKYSRFSTLIRSSFDEASNYFTDGSIDLLHIDGLHTYEAVKHDFEKWLPRLSPNAVVIFHDINVRERDFGVFKFWEELQQQYKNFQFDFGSGLGVIAIGNVDRDELEVLFKKNRGDKYYIFLRNLFSERGSAFKNNFDALLQATDSHKKLESNNNLLQENCNKLSEKLNLANSSSDKKNKELADQKNTIDELNAVIQKQSGIIRWYKDTYEDRSIIGVLTEKFKSQLKKKVSSNKEGLHFSYGMVVNDNKAPEQVIVLNHSLNGIIKKNRYYLKPAKDIKFLLESNEYVSGGVDPFFIVDFKNKGLRAGWYKLSIDIVMKNGILLSPKLYYDCGGGFNEKDVWNLPDIVDGKIESLIKFPFNLSALRFDPTTTECTFTVREFHLKAIGKIKVCQIGISKYKKIYLPQKSYSSFYMGMISDFLKTGKLEIKKKIWDAITYRESNSFDKYKEWYTIYDTISPGQLEIIKSLSENLSYQPLFSIIMPVYNAPVCFLKKAIESVKKQAYKNWELCIADDNSTDEGVKKLLTECQVEDPRIKVVFRSTNGHISNASNSALEIATGDFMVLLDQDDELPVHCLYTVAVAINKNKNLGIIYSDEDKIDDNGNRFDPYFKTDWNKDLFYGQNLISHLGVYKLSLVRKIGGFRVGFEGSQDYDLALRCIEHLRPEQIYHIPHVLYHWRAIKGSTAVAVSNKNYAISAALKALRDHFKRTDQDAIPEENVHNSYRIKWALREKEPLVSIIIPTRDKVDILSTCVASLLQNTGYANFEVLIIDNNSEEAITLAYLEQVQQEHKQVKVYPYNAEFNFSAMINYGLQQSNG